MRLYIRGYSKNLAKILARAQYLLLHKKLHSVFHRLLLINSRSIKSLPSFVITRPDKIFVNAQSRSSFPPLHNHYTLHLLGSYSNTNES